MGIDPHQLLTVIIRPTLRYLSSGAAELDSTAAEQLVLGTAIQESGCGEYLQQLGGGSAVSPWQMEPATAIDVMSRISDQYPALFTSIGYMRMAGFNLSAQLAGNLWLACALCRLDYWLDPSPLPDADDVQGLAAYYKRLYNTVAGAATLPEEIASFTAAVAAVASAGS